MTERYSEMPDEILGRRLATDLPRHVAPARLRVAIVEAAAPRPRRVWWLAPLMSAAAAALVVVLVFAQLLPRADAVGPSNLLLRAVVAEHTRTVLWGARHPDIIPAVTEESGIGLSRVFAGDGTLTLVNAEPVYIRGEHGVALHYRDTSGRLVSYIALRAPRFTITDLDRLQIERFRPGLARDGSFVTLAWKHDTIACFLVSNMVSPVDLETFKDYFLRIRTSTEPFLAY